MITLSNGHKIDFVCASGALSFDGNGYWWEKPFRWTGMLRPEAFTIITKSLTYQPIVGNLKLWKPWTCVKLLPDNGVANAVGLTNPGFFHWLRHIYPKLNENYRIIPSILPYTEDEAYVMAVELERCRTIVAIEVNISCPSAKTDKGYDPIKIIRTIRANTKHPIFAKVGYDQADLCKTLNPIVDGFDAINCVKWSVVFPKTPSPFLAKFGVEGSVSGGPIRNFSLNTLHEIKKVVTKPVINGGGVDSFSEATLRIAYGANAISLGSQTFLRNPVAANRIVDAIRTHGRIK